jgi:hypothetical protein
MADEEDLYASAQVTINVCLFAKGALLFLKQDVFDDTSLSS